MQKIEMDFYVNIRCNIKIMSYTHKGKKIYVHIVHKSKIYQKTYLDGGLPIEYEDEDGNNYEWYWNTFTFGKMLSRKDTYSDGSHITTKWKKKEYSCDGWTGCDTEDLKDLKEKYFTIDTIDQSSNSRFIEEKGILQLK